MRKPAHFLTVAAVLGIVASIFRIFELETAFDPQNGLAVNNAPVTWALLLLTLAASAAFLFFAARSWRPSYIEVMAAGSPSLLEKILCVAGGMFILASGAAEFALDPERPLSRAILALFAIFTGVSIFAVLFSGKKEGREREAGIFTLVPVFFACYRLIISYAERSSDPVVLHYVYDLLALISILLYLYYWAGFTLKNSHPRKAIFFGLLGVYFTLIVTAAPAIQFFRGGEIASLPVSGLLCYLGMGLFVAGTLESVSRPRMAPTLSRGEAAFRKESPGGSPGASS